MISCGLKKKLYKHKKKKLLLTVSNFKHIEVLERVMYVIVYYHQLTLILKYGLDFGS